MTKRHFEALAAMVREWRYQGNLTPVELDRITCDLARFCASQNPRFSSQRFYDACAGEDSIDSAGRTVRYSRAS